MNQTDPFILRYTNTLPGRLAQASAAFAKAQKQTEVLKALIHWAMTFVPLPHYWYNRYDSDTQTSITTYWSEGVPGIFSLDVITQPEPVHGVPLMEQLHFVHQPLYIPRCEAHPYFDAERLEAYPHRTFVGVPLIFEGSVAGVLMGGSFGDAEGFLDVDEEALQGLMGLCQIAALAINRLQAKEENERMERQFHQSQKLESLGVLAGGIAHDFNNLLMGVLGHGDIALELLEAQPAAARTHLESILGSAHRAAALTRQMLAYAGRGQVEVAPLDLGEEVRSMADLLRVTLDKNATLELNLAPRLPTVLGDGTQIQQVVMNLVLNAGEALQGAPGTIRLRTGVDEVEKGALQGALVGSEAPAGPYVWLEVSDTGCGMDAETQARIFEPFYTTKRTGRGLGLSALLGIVRSHRGAVRLYSEPGIGTTFKVLLPASQRALSKRPLADPAHMAQSGRVLLVEDDEISRPAISQMLERMGFEVVEAQDGVQALERLRDETAPFRLVLLDMIMPNLNGEATFRLIQERHPGTKVLLMSGFNEQEATRPFVEGGFAGFIQKPFGSAQLAEKLHQSLS